MEVETLIYKIQQLSLQKRFFVMEQTLKSIKNEELNKENKTTTESLNTEYKTEIEHHNDSYLLSENSLSKDWLSVEDERWDTIL